MNRQTLNYIDLVLNLVANLNAAQKATPLREVNIGYDLSKEQGLREYRRMSVGEFLSKVAGIHHIPRKLINIIDALISWASVPPQVSGKVATESARIESVAEPIQVNNGIKELPLHPELSFMEQASEVFDILISALMTLNESSVRSAERLRLSFDKGTSDKEIARLTERTYECVRSSRIKFQSDVIKGIVPKGLSDEYSISDKFLAEARYFVSLIQNRPACHIVSQSGNIGEERLRFILQALGLAFVKFDSVDYLVSAENANTYSTIVKEVHQTLSKEFDYMTLTSLCSDIDDSSTNFVMTYLESRPEQYEFNEDHTAVRMIGEGLQKNTRIARIIFKAHGWIDKSEVARIYAQQYQGEVPSVIPSSLRDMGFTPQNRTGKWKFGVVTSKLQDIIREIITPERPLATLKTIINAAIKAGLDYPISTIRAYITDIATPENKQNDLFCLKGYGHLYPNYSWRSYRKIVA